MSSYVELWGRSRQRVVKGHPRREERRERARARLVAHECTQTCKRYRTGRIEWPVSR